MNTVYQWLIYSHVAAGFISLVLFWIPVASRKGGALHLRAGRWYANTMYVVAGSALVLSLILMTVPLAAKHPNLTASAEELTRIVEREFMVGLFLLAISMLVVVGVRHGILTLKAKSDHAVMRSPLHLGLNLALLSVGLSLAVAAYGGSAEKILFYVFAGLCTFTAIGNLRYCLRKEVAKMEWLITHLNAMLGAGIASYTAFFVFGGNQFLRGILSGYWLLLPWFLPGVVGGAMIAWQTAKYRRKYAPLNSRAKANQPIKVTTDKSSSPPKPMSA